jgi:septal ring factor EnvC (AmiA/AmiB activator)
MNKLLLLVFLFGANPVLSLESKALSSENPMRKIISMLQSMAKEVEREGEAEKEIFEKALCACENGEEELDKTIADSQAAIEEYTAKVASGKAETAQLTQEVGDHKTTAAQAESDLEEATTLREKEYKAFIADEKDTKANLASVSKAIPAIEQGMAGASLMQLPGMAKKMDRFRRYVEVAKVISNDERSEVLSFLASGEGDQEQSKNSGEILGILKNMKDEMEKDLKEMQDEDAKAHNGFNDLKAAKSEEISINKKSVIEKEKRVGALALELSEGNHALEDAKEELANAEKFKANMKEQCAGMEKQKAMREKARADEIKAISEAVSILNDDDALEVFSAAKPSLVQQPKAQTYDALIQLMHKRVVVKRHISLLALNHKTHHHSKEEPAGPPPAPKDAAEKLVTGMINGMVGVLHDDDVSDEHKKAWCANETEVAHGIETAKAELIEKTTTEIAEQEDQIATLVDEIKGLTTKIQELDKLVHETTAQRKAEHGEFVDMFATSATAIRLVDKAIVRLDKFYNPAKFAKAKKAATDAALAKAGLALNQQKKHQAVLVQKKANDLLPGGFDALIQEKAHTESLATFHAKIRNGVDPIVLPETPKGSAEKQESGGVIALMNEFKNDLKLEMTEAETSEKFNAKEYVRIMTDAQETRAEDVKSLNHKKEAKATLDVKHQEAKQLLALTEEEHHNIQLYLVQVHTECDFLMKNFEARHEDRVDGESGLEEAETIVTDEEPPSHREIENRYKEEHTDDDVDEHFPGTAIDDGPDGGK